MVAACIPKDNISDQWKYWIGWRYIDLMYKNVAKIKGGTICVITSEDRHNQISNNNDKKYLPKPFPFFGNDYMDRFRVKGTKYNECTLLST